MSTLLNPSKGLDQITIRSTLYDSLYEWENRELTASKYIIDGRAIHVHTNYHRNEIKLHSNFYFHEFF